MLLPRLMEVTSLRISGVPDGPARERQIAQFLQRLYVVLRRLRHHAVADAVLRIQPERGLRLEAAAERNQQALRHVGLRVAALRGFDAVGKHVQHGLVEGLLDAQIGDAGNAAHLVQDAIRQLAIGLRVPADELHVDGCGKAEIENLADNIVRQEVEFRAGKLARQSCPQRPCEFLRWGDAPW
jgi:hypothetical protein